MFNKENFVEASFIDSERKNIEVLTKSDDGKSVIPTIIPFDETNHMFKELMDIKTLDELHEDTHNKKKLEGDLYKEQAIAFAKEAGLVTEENTTPIITKIIEYITKDTDNSDELFALKLGLFEVAEIKDSEDIELKKSLRQSKTKAEVLLNALKIICKK
tara:strand:- start:185 stop:661 length:477 start_codon:yes stop_codon:yes gene_type:complete